MHDLQKSKRVDNNKLFLLCPRCLNAPNEVYSEETYSKIHSGIDNSNCSEECLYADAGDSSDSRVPYALHWPTHEEGDNDGGDGLCDTD